MENIHETQHSPLVFGPEKKMTEDQIAFLKGAFAKDSGPDVEAAKRNIVQEVLDFATENGITVAVYPIQEAIEAVVEHVGLNNQVEAAADTITSLIELQAFLVRLVKYGTVLYLDSLRNLGKDQ